MRKELSQIELTELYLLGQMNEADKRAFELKMQQDPELAEDVKLQSLVMESIALSAFTAEMTAMHDRLAHAPKPYGKTLWYGLSGLILFLALGTGYYFLYGSSNPSLKANQPQTDREIAVQQVLEVSREKDITSFITEPDDNRKERKVLFSRKLNRSQRRETHLEDKGVNVDLNRFLPVEHKVTMNSDLDFTFQMADSRSFVHVPGNAMTKRSGDPVHGNVEIRYREYRNPAQTAFSKIPMTYSENGQDYNFNSAGMFEIRAYQNGEELMLVPEKPLIVDYNVTQRLDYLFFWKLEKDKWVKKQEIDFEKNDALLEKEQDSVDQLNMDWKAHSVERKDAGKIIVNVKSTFGEDLDEIMYRHKSDRSRWVPVYQKAKTDSGMVISNVYNASNDYKLTKEGYRPLVIKNVKAPNGTWTTVEASMQPKRKGGLIGKVGRIFTSAQMDERMKVRGSAIVTPNAGILPLLEKDSISRKIQKNRVAKMRFDSNGTLLASGMDKGHTYPDIVRGLNCPSFGVYNCDQIYRVEEPLAITPQFRDENGNMITNADVLSMVDLKYNGAFSFDPRQFTCAKNGRTMLLLFSGKKLYAIREEEFKAMNIDKTGSYTFIMKDISAEVKDSADLKKFMGLK